MTDEKSMMTHAIPWDLHRLPDFDYMKFAQVQDIGEGKQTLVLSLEGRKTWFRLACPNGGLVLNALRVTDTMAIFEARVFADAEDRNPLASVTATQKAEKAKGEAYISAAQEAALNEALKNAGFCLEISTLAYMARDKNQLPQSSQADDAGQTVEAPAEQPMPAAPTQADAPVQKLASVLPVEEPAQPPKPVVDTDPRPAPVDPPPHADASQRPAPVAPQPRASGENRPAPAAPQSHGSPAPEKKETGSAVVNISDARQPVAVQNKPDGQPAADIPPTPEAAPVTAPAPEAADEAAKPAAVTYTPDMPVDEICLHMTLEQAKAVKVLDGTCKGWTLAQVAKDRPTSLRWLQSVCPFADNELKAAATIVLNDLELRKAG